MKGDRIGELEELTLVAVLALGEGAYGVAVQRLIEQESGRDVTLGAVYAALDRMERKGYVRSALTGPIAARGGKRRRVFEVTQTGRRAVHEARRVREALWLSVPRALRGRT